MKQLISKTFKENKKLFENHNKVLVAVSGGIDSIVLLHYLEEVQSKFGIELGVAHINHGLRAQSVDEEKYLRKYCENKNIPIYVGYFDGKSFSENNAREFRYNFFKEIMDSYGYTSVVTAHHKDDQSETIFMKFIRGCRLLDLGGIKQTQRFHTGELIRPFLNVKKSDLPDLFHFEDETNKGTDYFRNRVRNIYIPEMENENPAFSSQLVEFGKEVTSLTNSFKELINGIQYNELKTFRKYSKDTQFYFIQDYLTQFPELQPNKNTITDLLNMLNSNKVYNQHFKANYKIIITKENWKIENE